MVIVHFNADRTIRQVEQDEYLLSPTSIMRMRELPRFDLVGTDSFVIRIDTPQSDQLLFLWLQRLANGLNITLSQLLQKLDMPGPS